MSFDQSERFGACCMLEGSPMPQAQVKALQGRTGREGPANGGGEGSPSVRPGGAREGDILARRGRSPETATRLGRQAEEAQRAGFPHGVSVTTPEANLRLARDPTDASNATRQAFEQAGFPVHYTPTRTDPSHHAVELPHPVTPEVADRFNTVLGRNQ